MAKFFEKEHEWQLYCVRRKGPAEVLKNNPIFHYMGSTDLYHEIAGPEDVANGYRDYGFEVLADLHENALAPTCDEICTLGPYQCQYMERATDGILKHGWKLGACYRRQTVGRFLWIEARILLHVLPMEGPAAIKFSQTLVFLAFNVQTNPCHDSVQNIQKLSAREIMQEVRQSLNDLLKENEQASLHTVSLVRYLLSYVGVPGDIWQLQLLNKDRTHKNNLSVLAALIGVEGSNTFGTYDMGDMRHALRQSKVYDRDVSPEELVDLNLTLPSVLPIAGPQLPVLPINVRCELTQRQSEDFLDFVDQTYSKFGSLNKVHNTILLFILWGFRHDSAKKLVSDWMASQGDFLEHMKEAIQRPQEPLQLTLSLSAMYCIQQVRCCPGADTYDFRGPCHLRGFDSFLQYENQENNDPHVLRRMTVTLVHVISTHRSMQGFASFIQKSVDLPDSILGPGDALSQVYWCQRICHQDFGHEVAYETTVGLLERDTAPMRERGSRQAHDLD